MNQYRCETCSYHPLHGKILKCPYDGAGIDEQIYYTLKEEMRLPRAAELFTSIVGCASHNDFQSERDAVLERLHIWFENYCEGNEDPDLWVAFLHAERTLRQKCKEVGNIW